MKKKVLIVSYYFSQRNAIGALRVKRLYRYLCAFDWIPHVLTIRTGGDMRSGEAGDPPHVTATGELRFNIFKLFGAGKRRTAIHARGRRAADSGIESVGFKKKVENIYYLIGWMLGWAPFGVARGMRTIRRERIDVLVSSGPPLNAYMVAYMLKLFMNIPWVIDLRDPIDIGYCIRAETRFLLPFVRRLERIFVRKTNVIICSTERMKNHYHTLFPEKRIEAIRNSYEPDDFAGVSAERGDDEKNTIIISHIGSFYETARVPDSFLRALSDILRSDGGLLTRVKVKFIGSKQYVDTRAYRDLVVSLGLDNVIEVVPCIPHTGAVTEMLKADILLLLQPDPVTNLQVPAKVYEYIGAEKTILGIAPTDSATYELLDTYELGYPCDPRETEGLRATLRRLLTSGGGTGHTVIAKEQYAARGMAGEFARILDSLSSRS